MGNGNRKNIRSELNGADYLLMIGTPLQKNKINKKED